MQPSQSLLTLATAMFANAWDQRSARAGAVFATLKRDITKIEKQIDGLLDRIVEASTPPVISAYEKRIAKMEREKLVLQEKLESGPKPKATFDDLFELAQSFLANPCKIWGYGHLALRRTLLRLAFTERLNYSRKTGLRTPKFSLPFNMLGEENMQKCVMAERKGFEPSRRFPAYTLSRRAPSTTRPPLRRRVYQKFENMCKVIFIFSCDHSKFLHLWMHKTLLDDWGARRVMPESW